MAPVSVTFSSVGGVVPQNILDSIEFDLTCGCLLDVSSDSISVFTDDSLAGLSTVSMQAGAAVFFDGVDLGLDVVVSGLVSSTMVELQAIALALECVPLSSSIYLFSNSQAALDACRSELSLVNLDVSWFKVKGHFGVVDNKWADALAVAASTSDLFFSSCLTESYILVDGIAVSGNSRYFVCDIFHCVHHTKWEIGSGSKILVSSLHKNIDWCRSSFMWHPDKHMATDFTGKRSAGACTYFMKALHYQLPMAVHKCLYSRSYPSILCLFCGGVKFSDHIFSCGFDTAIHAQLLDTYAAIWGALPGLSQSLSRLIQLMLSCASDALVCSAFCKGFMFKLLFSGSGFSF
ncbi:hypothetical protein G9A89_014797 [Geosiphon pyriformis]|nr:hypothetical protein G9A89_014797 [Geosiphon pyriformis]